VLKLIVLLKHIIMFVVLIVDTYLKYQNNMLKEVKLQLIILRIRINS
jgi:hypothetical protein